MWHGVRQRIHRIKIAKGQHNIKDCRKDGQDPSHKREIYERHTLKGGEVVIAIGAQRIRLLWDQTERINKLGGRIEQLVINSI